MPSLPSLIANSIRFNNSVNFFVVYISKIDRYHRNVETFGICDTIEDSNLLIVKMNWRAEKYEMAFLKGTFLPRACLR